MEGRAVWKVCKGRKERCEERNSCRRKQDRRGCTGRAMKGGWKGVVVGARQELGGAKSGELGRQKSGERGQKRGAQFKGRGAEFDRSKKGGGWRGGNGGIGKWVVRGIREMR